MSLDGPQSVELFISPAALHIHQLKRGALGVRITTVVNTCKHLATHKNILISLHHHITLKPE